MKCIAPDPDLKVALHIWAEPSWTLRRRLQQGRNRLAFTEFIGRHSRQDLGVSAYTSCDIELALGEIAFATWVIFMSEWVHFP